jgi:hypothetical protein
VFGLAEVKQVGWLEHGGKLIERGAAEKGNGAGVLFALAGCSRRWLPAPQIEWMEPRLPDPGSHLLKILPSFVFANPH